MKGSKAPVLLVVILGAVMIFAVYTSIPEFGSFPSRTIGPRSENAVGQNILENALPQTGSGNAVTDVVWGYRGYDTLGEATVLFTAVLGVVAIFRAARRRRK
ncbi:MAG: hydrogen gas-evolving membrane-bound hydrogenase subunit E [Candidatus Hadarchaeales archaeon]